MITSAQIRGARAMLGMTQAALATAAGLSAASLNAIERGTSDPKVSSLRAVQAALEAAGITFTNGDEPGVKLRQPSGAPPSHAEGPAS